MKQYCKTAPILFLILLIFGLSAHTGIAQSKQFELISVENKTSALTVVSIENKGPLKETKEKGHEDLSFYYVKVRNDYDKPVAMYKLEGWDEKSGQPTNDSVNGTFLSKWTFKPGLTMTTIFVASTGGKVRLTTKAVIFEDGSGEGDSVAIATLQERRKGLSLGYQRLTPILREVRETPGYFSAPVGITDLIRKIGEIRPDQDASAPVKEGVEDAKSDLGRLLHQIEYFMSSDKPLNAQELLAEKLADMEFGLKRFSETTLMKVASVKKK